MFNRDRPSHRTALSDNAESSPGPANPRADAPAARALRPRRGWRTGRRLSLTQVLVRRRPATGIDHATGGTDPGGRRVRGRSWERKRRSPKIGSRTTVASQRPTAPERLRAERCAALNVVRACGRVRDCAPWVRSIAVTKYTPSALLNPREHRLTERHAATLEHSGELASLLVSDWLAIDPRKESRVRTQRACRCGVAESPCEEKLRYVNVQTSQRGASTGTGSTYGDIHSY